MAAAGKAGTGRPPGAARTAANTGAAARGAGGTTAATAVGPPAPPAGRGATPRAGTTPSQPRRNYLGIGLAVLAALVFLGVLAYFMRPTVNVNVHTGGAKVTVILPTSRDSAPTTAPSSSPSTKPAATPSPSSSSASPSPSPSSSSPMESGYSHWISPADVTTACHEQASPETTAVFQNALYNASPVAEDWYCQIIQGETHTYWYSANSPQPLGPIIATSPGNNSVDLSRYCQYTYGSAGDGQWEAQNGANNAYGSYPPAPGNNPFPHEMCYKLPNSGT